MRRLYFDTETTGKLPKFGANQKNTPRIVQLAAVVIDDEEGEVSSMNVIVKPDGWKIPNEAAAIHGITTEKAERFGIPLAAALGAFSNLCGISDQAVAHNEAFDTPVIKIEHQRENRICRLASMERFCTMKAAEPILKIPGFRPGQYKWPKLQEVHVHYFGEEFDGAHDALADVRATARIHAEILKEPKP